MGEEREGKMDQIIVGLDEAGRGPWAGPVVAAAVILDPSKPIAGLTDSKKLTEIKRNKLFDEIKQKSLAWAIASAEVDEIDSLNILQASFLAMQRAVQQLAIKPTYAFVDGNLLPDLGIPGKAIIEGDLLEPCISAASILAKVYRDQQMILLEEQYPGYGFAKHKGYGTKVHQQALKQLGPSVIHRKSFKPIKALLDVIT